MQHRLSVFWVRADSLANFLNDFSQIMDQLESSKAHASNSQDRPLLARNVTDRLQNDPNSWLLVLDNADNYNLFVGTSRGANAISSYVPKEGRVLITTRDPRFQGTVAAAKDGLHVEPMNTSEARDLFMKSIPDHLASQSSPAIVDELIELLGNLPLALAQAAANIADQQRPVQEYTAAYREKRNRPLLMQKPALDLETQDSRTSRQSILATYEISFEDLERDHQSSARCLNYFGFFHWHKIPESCIRAVPELRELDDQSFRAMIKRLLHLSLIEETPHHDGSEYSVHPVIHERISDRLSPEEKSSYLSDSVVAMLSKFPETKATYDLEDFASGRYLQSHALLQINFATDINLKSGTLARLNLRCAKFLRVSGMTFDSVQLASQAVAIAQEVWGPQSRRTIDACVQKIDCLFHNAQYQEAYNELISALEMWDSAKLDDKLIRDSNHLFRGALILHRLAEACRILHKYEEAEEARNKLTILNSDLPEDFEISLYKRLRVVEALSQQGRFQEAQEKNNEVLNSMDEQQGTLHRFLYLHTHSLEADILSNMRKGSDAEPAVVLNDDDERAILRIRQDLFNESWARLPITDVKLWRHCNSLLEELSGKGKIPEAAKILESILARVVESRLRLEGRILAHFASTLRLGLEVINSLHGTRDARQKPPGLPIAELFVQIIELAGTASRKFWRSSLPLINFSELFLRLGNSHKAEELLREALQDTNLEEDGSFEGRIHYGIMFAIARQGRTHDARLYRNTHLDLIAPEESTRGDLDHHLQLHRKEKKLYDRAKDIIAGRESRVPESWWNEHRIRLNRAQLRYGLLVPERTEDDPDPDPHGDASDNMEKKQKGKSRRLGSLIDRFHRTSLSAQNA